MNRPPSWKQFVAGELLSHNAVSGVVLMSHQAESVYSYGELNHLKQEDLQQFQNIFCFHSDKQVSLQQSFCLKTQNGNYVDFKVYHKSYCSIYATSEGRANGLVICNVPHGILICTYHHPVKDTHAVQVIENFCGLLRA